MSQIITFYSYKGGVGRTMALANIACSIAAKGHKVLIVDWDLEAPGLHRYFAGYEICAPAQSGGTIGLLEALSGAGSADSSPFESTVSISKTEFFGGCQIQLLDAGMSSKNYESRVLDFKFKDFYRKKQGAAKLEALRETWRERFGFVLIDSRTGITDVGGICTIFLPDVLALVFTPNEQSLAGVIDVAQRAQKGRQMLSFDRRGLTLFPIPSRLELRFENEESDRWMRRFSDELKPFLSPWCPMQLPSRTLFEKIKIPYVPFFSFGEKLPIVTHTIGDADLPGFYYENIAKIFVEEFTERAVLSASGIAPQFKSDVSRITALAPAKLVGRDDHLSFLDEIWQKISRDQTPRPHIVSFVALGGEGKTSLIAKWVAELAHRDWPGCDAAFAWSFTQDTREVAGSSDLFFKEAIAFFGNETDKQFAASSAGALEKGQRLARIIGERRSLLILDGLESLQYSPTSPTPGELKDVGLIALLRGLAVYSSGLCIVTSRYSLPDLRAFWQTNAPEVKLLRLSREAGVNLLMTLGVKGTATELETLVEDVKGHALTLNLLGTYLRDAHGGDIRRRDIVKLEEADMEGHGGQAFRLMERYVDWFDSEGERGKRALAVLSLLGLFSRSPTPDLIAALAETPAIPNLTEPLTEMSDAQRNLVLKRLEEAKLLTVIRDPTGALVSLDTHPLIREYFSRRLRTQHPETWRAAHQRLFESLCANTPDKDEPVLEDLRPLYQAIAHGCQAGLHRQAFEVFYVRINREQQFYSTRKLGAYASNLGAVAWFFEEPWSRVSPELAGDEAWLLAVAANNLRAVGRLVEALEPMRSSLKMYINQAEDQRAAIAASNLSDIELTLGKIDEAVRDAEQSVSYADRSANKFHEIAKRATSANALHQAGRQAEAEARFHAAEVMQREYQPQLPLLFAVAGFQYCDLLMSAAERAVWRRTLAGGNSVAFSSHELSVPSKLFQDVSNRTMKGLEWVELGGKGSLLDVALGHLTVVRASLYDLLLSQTSPLPDTKNSELRTTIDNAVNELRRTAQLQYLPLGLFTRAMIRFLIEAQSGSDSAQEDLDEAWEIAERGPMRLYMADIHLYRARLFFRESRYPWESPEADLRAAEKLINDCGYHRRDEELADAKRVILGQSV